jgi:exodeoxyribonuclease VII large subunit
LRYRQRLDNLHRQALNELRGAFRDRQQQTDELGMRIVHYVQIYTKSCAKDVQRLASQLRALGPLAVLDRGYSITRQAGGDIVRSADMVKEGDTVETRVARGTFHSVVQKGKKGEGHGR